MVGCVGHSAPYALNNAHEIRGLADAGLMRLQAMVGCVGVRGLTAQRAIVVAPRRLADAAQ